MSAGIIKSVLSSGFELSQGEAAFRPWWDTVEDNIVHTLVIIGLVVLPTSLLISTSLDCTYCNAPHCEGNTLEDPDLQAYFVKKYCTYQADLSPLILYYPFILLLIATVLVMVDRPFVLRLFKSVNMEEIYRLVVVETAASPHTQRQRLVQVMSLTSGNYFLSYLSRTLLSLVSSLLPLLLLSLYLPHLDSATYKCKVHDLYYYECAGYPAQFYKYLTMIVIILLAFYFLLNLYNTAWLLLPALGKLRRIMTKFRTQCFVHRELEEFYYKNRDIKLLLNLLSSSQGLASPLRCIAIMDQTFNDSLSPIVTKKYLSKETLQVVIKRSGKEDSMLSTVSKMPGIRVGFMLTANDVKSSCFTETETSEDPDHMQASLASVENGDKVEVKTTINGKVIASSEIVC